MDLTMCILILLFSQKVFLDILSEHSNHRRFFFFDIKKLDKPLSEQLFEHPLLFKDHSDMLLLDHHFIVIDNEHGSLDSSSICINLDFLFFDVSDNGVLLG